MAGSPRLGHSLERCMPPLLLMIMKKLARVSCLKMTPWHFAPLTWSPKLTSLGQQETQPPPALCFIWRRTRPWSRGAACSPASCSHDSLCSALGLLSVPPPAFPPPPAPGASHFPGRASGPLRTSDCAPHSGLGAEAWPHMAGSCHPFTSSPSHSVWMKIFPQAQPLYFCFIPFSVLWGKFPRPWETAKQDEPQL